MTQAVTSTYSGSLVSVVYEIHDSHRFRRFSFCQDVLEKVPKPNHHHQICQMNVTWVLGESDQQRAFSL